MSQGPPGYFADGAQQHQRGDQTWHASVPPNTATTKMPKPVPNGSAAATAIHPPFAPQYSVGSQSQVPSAAFVSAPPAVDQGRKWVCGRCTFENERNAQSCLICEWKPQQQQQQTGFQPQRTMSGRLAGAPPPSQAFQPVQFPPPVLPPVIQQQQQQFQPPRQAPPPPQNWQQQPLQQPVVSAKPATEWNCVACTYLNPIRNVKCEICDTARPIVAATPAQNPSQGGHNPFETFWRS